MDDPHELTGQIVALLNMRDSLANLRDDVLGRGDWDASLGAGLADAIERIETITDQLYARWQTERGRV